MEIELDCKGIDYIEWKDKRVEEVDFNKLEDFQKEEIMVGDICRVINASHLYSTYYYFSNKAGHPDIEKKKYVTSENSHIVKSKEVRILYVKKYNSQSSADIAIVETVNNPEYLKFMIDVKGLLIVMNKKKEEMDIQLFIKDYLSGKILKEKIPDACIGEFLLHDIIARNPMDIQYVNPKLLTDEHYKRILSKDGGLLGLIPIERRTLLLCQVAIEEEPYAQKFVPEELRSLVKY